MSSEKRGTIARERLKPTKSVPKVSKAREGGSWRSTDGPKQAFWTHISRKAVKIMYLRLKYFERRTLRGAPITYATADRRKKKPIHAFDSPYWL